MARRADATSDATRDEIAKTRDLNGEGSTREMETVRAYVARMNRPLNATNVGDALGASGVKKGLAQKYLDALVDKGRFE